MPVTGFAHYNLRAPRPLLERLRDFYVHVVGLHEGQRPSFRKFGYWLYAGGEPVLHLAEDDAALPAAGGATTSCSHAAFACSDLEGTERRLRSLGVAYRRTQVPETGEPQLFFNDPAGNGVELIFLPGPAPTPRADRPRPSGW